MLTIKHVASRAVRIDGSAGEGVSRGDSASHTAERLVSTSSNCAPCCIGRSSGGSECRDRSETGRSTTPGGRPTSHLSGSSLPLSHPACRHHHQREPVLRRHVRLLFG